MEKFTNVSNNENSEKNLIKRVFKLTTNTYTYNKNLKFYNFVSKQSEA